MFKPVPAVRPWAPSLALATGVPCPAGADRPQGIPGEAGAAWALTHPHSPGLQGPARDGDPSTSKGALGGGGDPWPGSALKAFSSPTIPHCQRVFIHTRTSFPTTEERHRKLPGYPGKEQQLMSLLPQSLGPGRLTNTTGSILMLHFTCLACTAGDSQDRDLLPPRLPSKAFPTPRQKQKEENQVFL